MVPVAPIITGITLVFTFFTLVFTFIIIIIIVKIKHKTVLKRLLTPSDRQIPLPSTVPFAHSEPSFTHGCIIIIIIIIRPSE
jgi:Na+-transporting methylmalonyl-CoA/oxaloacetate decarboxylase gamma subunit